MNRTIFGGIAIFFAVLTIAMVGNQNSANAGWGCHGGCGGLFSHSRCHGGLFARHRCHCGGGDRVRLAAVPVCDCGGAAIAVAALPWWSVRS